VTAGVKEACDLIDAGFEYVCDMDMRRVIKIGIYILAIIAGITLVYIVKQKIK